jgi:hypothetical protein
MQKDSLLRETLHNSIQITSYLREPFQINLTQIVINIKANIMQEASDVWK